MSDESARFLLRTHGRDHPLKEGKNVAGRSRSSDVRVQDAKVSRRHAILHVSGETIELEDLGSLNGTFVNADRVDGRQILLPGDVVRFGDTDVLLIQGALAPDEHEVRTPIQSGYRRLPMLDLPSVITEDADTSELTRPSPELGLRVILAVRDTSLVDQLARQGARLLGAKFEHVDPSDLYGQLASAPPGALVLELDGVGPAASDVVRAWRGPEYRPDVVMVLGTLDVEEGELYAARIGADTYLPLQTAADEVIRKLRDAMDLARARRHAP